MGLNARLGAGAYDRPRKIQAMSDAYDNMTSYASFDV